MSKQVKRYKVWEADLVLPDDSEVVLASDYAALQAEYENLRIQLKDSDAGMLFFLAQRDELRAELAALKEKGAMS